MVASRDVGADPVRGRTKASDVSDAAFLEAVATVRATRPGGVGASVWDVAEALGGNLDHVRALARGDETGDYPRGDRPESSVPYKVVEAKARRLIRRGLLTGCTCGCRGDFEVVDFTKQAESAVRLALVEAAVREHVEGRCSHATGGETAPT